VPEYTETNSLTDGGLVGRFQDQAVVTRFLDTAKIGDIGVLIRDQQADNLGVEFARARQVAHREPDMAGPGDIEGGREIGLGYGHTSMHSESAPMVRI